VSHACGGLGERGGDGHRGPEGTKGSGGGGRARFMNRTGQDRAGRVRTGQGGSGHDGPAQSGPLNPQLPFANPAPLAAPPWILPHQPH